MSKRFWAFAGSTYYPAGGIHDLVGTFDTAEEAEADVEANKEDKMYDWWHIVDIDTASTVKRWRTEIYKHR